MKNNYFEFKAGIAHGSGFPLLPRACTMLSAQNVSHAIQVHGAVYTKIYSRGWTFMSAWKNNHMLNKVWDEITYPFLNVNGSAVEICEWKSNSRTHYIMDVFTHPCWDES